MSLYKYTNEAGGNLYSAARLDGEGNPVTDVQPTGSIGKEQIIASDANSLAIGEQREILNRTDQSVVIDDLTFATESEAEYEIRISLMNNGVFESLPIISFDNNFTATPGITPLRISLWGSDWFKIMEYDTTNNIYKFSLAKSIYAAEGIKITITNDDPNVSINQAINVTGRQFT